MSAMRGPLRALPAMAERVLILKQPSSDSMNPQEQASIPPISTFFTSRH